MISCVICCSTRIYVRHPVSSNVVAGEGLLALAAYLGENVEVCKLGRCLRRAEWILFGGFAKKLPSCILVEQLVTAQEENGLINMATVASGSRRYVR
jgi:hypothetical protein